MFKAKVDRKDIISDEGTRREKAYAVAIYGDTFYEYDQFRYATHAQAQQRLDQLVADHPTVLESTDAHVATYNYEDGWTI
jgi:hypothetical protein